MQKSRSIPVSAEKVAAGLEDWIVEELKGRTGRYFELGKFLFTVSTGILVFFSTAIKTVGTHACSNHWLVFCVLFAITGILASVWLVWPRNTQIGPELDALEEFNNVMFQHRVVLFVWTLLTILALGGGFLSLVEIGPSCSFWK